jgi:PAS domain S-box-containing protein
LKHPHDQTTSVLLAELGEIRRTVEEIKKLETDRLLEEGLFRTLEYGSQMAIVVIQDGRFAFVNRITENHWGYTLEEFIGRDALSIVHHEDRERVRHASVKMLKGQLSTPFVFRALTKDGSIRWVTETVASIPYEGRRAVLANYMDITDQIESRQKLEELEALEASILEAMPNAVIGLHNRRIIFANDGVENVFGWKAKDLIGKNTRILYRSDKDYEDMDKFVYTLMEKQRTISMEVPCRRKDGRDIECAISAARIGKYLKEKNIVIIYEDITERRQAKNELEQSREQLRKLTAHLQSVREKERTLIARELHDELGQLLTALNTETVLLSRKIPPEFKALIERTDSMAKLIDMTMQTLKRIYMSLRPGMLDHLGLTVSMAWQAEEFEKRTGIPCRIKIHPEDMSLDPDLSTTLFRIFQETLTNISRHAEATLVSAQLKATAKSVELVVKDNGRGITKEQRQKPHSFGLLGIRERVANWGGNVKINGIAGKGTTVHVAIPLKEKGPLL